MNQACSLKSRFGEEQITFFFFFFFFLSLRLGASDAVLLALIKISPLCSPAPRSQSTLQIGRERAAERRLGWQRAERVTLELKSRRREEKRRRRGKKEERKSHH